MTRFNTQIETNKDYTVQYTGTVPGKMRYGLTAQGGGMIIKVPYYDAGSVQVEVDGDVKEMTPWDDSTGQHAELTKQKGCGENRFVGIQNYLEFYIDSGCTVYIEPKDAILGLVRLRWTLSEFYADGGVTRFVDRLASSLGIHRSKIKTVAVYEGSVIIDFFIESDYSSDEDPEEAEAELQSITDALIEVITTSSDALGAEVLGVEGNGELLFGDPIPKDGTAAGNGYAAIRKDDNIWDRFVRIQESISAQLNGDDDLFSLEGDSTI